MFQHLILQELLIYHSKIAYVYPWCKLNSKLHLNLFTVTYFKLLSVLKNRLFVTSQKLQVIKSCTARAEVADTCLVYGFRAITRPLNRARDFRISNVFAQNGVAVNLSKRPVIRCIFSFNFVRRLDFFCF